MRAINLIVVHCSASQPLHRIDAAEIRRWHKERGFLDIGYHYVIKANGDLENGRDLTKAGAHANGFNANSIGICLVGGVNKAGKSENNFNAVQFKTLKTLIYQLKCLYPDTRICGHRDLPKVAKDCPCFDVSTWLQEVGLGASSGTTDEDEYISEP